MEKKERPSAGFGAGATTGFGAAAFAFSAALNAANVCDIATNIVLGSN